MEMSCKSRICQRIRENIPWIVLFLLFAVIGASVKVFRDDIYYSKQLLTLEAIKDRLSWSARVLNEIPLVLYTRHFWIFRILYPVMWTVTAVYTAKIFTHKADIMGKWAVALLILSYQIEINAEAGWAANASNYTFAYPLLLFGLYGFVKMIRKLPFRWYEYPLHALAFLFGTNEEQLAAIGFLTAVLLFVVITVRERRIRLYPLVLTLIAAIELVWLATAPSVTLRGLHEVHWFIDWEVMSLSRKCILGYQHALSTLFYMRNELFTAVSGLLFIRVWLLRKDVLSRLIAGVPLFITLACGLRLFNASTPFFEWIANMAPFTGSYNVGVINVMNYHKTITYIAFILPAIGAICTFVSLFNAFEDIRESLVAVWALAMAFISSFILGLSPTVWASGQRTNFFMMMLIAAIGAMVFRKIAESNKKSAVGILAIIVPLAAITFSAALYTAITRM